PLDLGPEAQDEPAAGKLRQVTSGHRGDRRTPRERQGDVGPHLDPSGRRARHGGLDERRSGRLAYPPALEPGVLDLSSEPALRRKLASDDHAEVHDGEGYTAGA